MKRTMGSLCALAVAIVLGGVAADADGSGSGRVKLFLNSAINVNVTGKTLTLPLFEGRARDGSAVWYIVTDSSDRDDAEARGVNWAGKLANALGSGAVQNVTVAGGLVRFAGTVDFRPSRIVVGNPSTGFPPDQASPGSVGDANYSPFITAGNGIVLNASQVANNTGLHDKVLSIDFSRRQVTLALTSGFVVSEGNLYISTDSSDPVNAALEGATFAPNMNGAPGLGSNDPNTSARSAIVPVVNGPTGVTNPNRQGLQSAVLGEGDPLNVTQSYPNNSGDIPKYSPMWDVHPAIWTEAAIAAGQRTLLGHTDEIAKLVREGRLVSGGTGPSNPSLGGLRAAGFIVNCPLIAFQVR